MDFGSPYIIQTNIIPIGDIPFSYRKYKPIFSRIFNNKRCFLKNSSLFLFKKNEKPNKSNPFIKSLGQICFNSQRVQYFKQQYAYLDVADLLLGKNNEEYNRDLEENKSEYYKEEEIFGYDINLEDQRMNNLYYELYKPVTLTAHSSEGCKAKGKLFIHIYPSGYLILQLAVSLKGLHKSDIDNLKLAIEETRPWRQDTKWRWESKFGSTSLHDLLIKVVFNTSQSLCNGRQIKLNKNYWHSLLSIDSTNYDSNIVQYLFSDKVETFNLKYKNHSYLEERIISSRQGVIFFHDPRREERDCLLHSIWKIMSIYELLLLRQQIYHDYINFLNTEISRLTKERLNPLAKFDRKTIFRLFVYNSTIQPYFEALENMIKNATPFYRAIYSSISNGISFGDDRKKLKEVIEKWEVEVSQWKSFPVFILKQIVLPIKSLIGK